MATAAARPASSPSNAPVLAHAGVPVPQLGLPEVHAHPVRLVDLARLLRPYRSGEPDPVVAGNGEADRLLPAGEYVNEDQRVRVVPAGAVGHLLRVTRVQGRQHPAGQDVTVPIPAALQPHEQDVLRAIDGPLLIACEEPMAPTSRTTK